MVQVGTSVDQQREGEGRQEDQTWPSLINDAVKDFVKAITESSQQLAAAAERFAGDSLGMIETATSKAESSATVSGEMAEAAKKAASEAQAAAQSLQIAVGEAGEQIRNETRNSIDETLAQAREAQQVSERAKAELRQQAEELIQRIERSGEGSQEVVRAAEQATEEVRRAAETVSQVSRSVDASVAEAQAAAARADNAADRTEGLSGQVAATSSDLQQVLNETRGIASRTEERADSAAAAAESARLASEAASAAVRQVEESALKASVASESSERTAEQAQHAAERIESTADSFESTIKEVRAVAEQTREAVTRLDQTAASATSAAGNAWQASAAAAEAAQRAEQAGANQKLGAGADSLLERLENDYQLLTSLVQELASRITSMATVAASQVEAADASAPMARSWESNETPPLTSYEAPVEEDSSDASTESQYVAEVSAEPPSWSAQTDPESLKDKPSNLAWVEKTISYAAPVSQEQQTAGIVNAEAEVSPASAHDESSAASWHPIASAPEAPTLEPWSVNAEPAPIDEAEVFPSEQSVAVEASIAESTSDLSAAVEESALLDESPVAEQQASDEKHETSLSGRVQVCISPVPDFDRLLNLDSALSRVESVQTVTLADYAQEEVTFRIDLANPLDAADFARQLSEAAGIGTEVSEAASGSVTLRLA